jgi:hypothetical protein
MNNPRSPNVSSIHPFQGQQLQPAGRIRANRAFPKAGAASLQGALLLLLPSPLQAALLLHVLRTRRRASLISGKPRATLGETRTTAPQVGLYGDLFARK